MNAEKELDSSEQRRQHNNLFHQAEVISASQGLVSVTVVTASGEVTFQDLMLLGRNSGAIKVGEPCLVICPQGDPSQGVVIMQMPDPAIDALSQQVETLKSQISGFQRQIQQLASQLQQVGSSN